MVHFLLVDVELALVRSVLVAEAAVRGAFREALVLGKWCACVAKGPTQVRPRESGVGTRAFAVLQVFITGVILREKDS